MFVRKHPRQVLFIFAIAALILAGCNVGATPAPTLDVNAINTAIVGTTVAQLSSQFTQTAQAQPTNTPVPTETAVTLPTFALPTIAGASPTVAGALPTISFNSTPGVNTPVAGFTQLASPIPAGQATAVLGDACNNAVYEGDVTIPDGTIMKPGQDFVKTWAMRNTGTCTWDEGYQFVFIGGDQALDPVNYTINKTGDFIAAGEGVNVSVNLTAPIAPGKYSGTWRWRTDNGYYFGQIVSVYIEVKK